MSNDDQPYPGDRGQEGVGPAQQARAQQVPTCYRHSDRETYIRCQRCGRYICPDCMHQAAVGVQCPECVREGARSTPAARSRFGGVLRQHENLITKIIIGVNIAVFLLTQVPTTGRIVVRDLELVGATGFGPSGGVAGGELWRLLTAAFVHVQIWHVGINMFMLWILGPVVERLLGRWRFLALYLTSAVAASAVAYAFTAPTVAVIGASGALFGVFGSMVLFARRLRADMTWILGTVLLNLLLGVLFRGLLSWQAHLGGFLAGLVLGAALAYAPVRGRTTMQVLGFAAVLVAAAALVGWRTAQLT